MSSDEEFDATPTVRITHNSKVCPYMYEPLAKVQSQAASESDNEHEGDTLFEDNFMPDDTVL